MTTTIAKYYTEEMTDWDKTIIYYFEEIKEFEQKLADVIRRNSILDIAAKVAQHQSHLNYAFTKFSQLHDAINRQGAALRTDGYLVDNEELINSDTEKYQKQLRHSMQQVEKEYIDIKFNCYNFLSSTLKK